MAPLQQEHAFHNLHHQLPPARQIDRTEMLTQIAEDLAELENNSAKTMTLLNYYGLTGTGKSVLIDQIFRKYAKTHATIQINFDLNQQQGAAEISNWKDLADVLRKLPALAYIPDTITLSSGLGKQQKDIQFEECQIICDASDLELANHKPLILLFDHLDDLTYWKWVQEEIIQPLYTQSGLRTLIVCTSQSPLFWNFWELSEICIKRDLGLFSSEQIRKLLKKLYDNDVLAPKVLAPSVEAMTQGHPLQIAYLVEFLKQSAQSDMSLTSVPTEELAKLTSHDIIAYIGLLRQAEVSVMIKLLDQFLPDWKQERSPYALLQEHVMPEIKAAGYMDPYRSGQPYRFIRRLRLAVEHIRRAEGSATFLDICLFLMDIYQSRFLKNPNADIQAFAEWIYFSLPPLAEGRLSREAWTQQMLTLFGRAREANIQPAILLYKDQELYSQLREISVFEQVKQLIDQYSSKRVPVNPLLNPIELDQYKRLVLERLTQQPPILRIQKYIPLSPYELLHTISRIGGKFDPTSLYSALRKITPDIQQISVNNSITLLHASGLIKFDSSSRVYSLGTTVQTLVAPTR